MQENRHLPGFRRKKAGRTSPLYDILDRGGYIPEKEFFMPRKTPPAANVAVPVSPNQPPVAPGIPPAINKPKPPKSPVSPAADGGTAAPVTGPGTSPMKRRKADVPPAAGAKPNPFAKKPPSTDETPPKKPFPGAKPPFQAKR